MKTINYSVALTIASDGFFLEEPDSDQKDIVEYLRRVTENNVNDEDEVLVFDPESGELIVQNPRERKPHSDSVVITSIVRSGWFSRHGATTFVGADKCLSG
ncbi:MAG: hypothetical protein ACK40Q_10340 [Pseudothermotoga sp.]